MPTYENRIKTNKPMRLDLYIAQELKLMTRSQLKTRNLIATLNNKTVKLACKIQGGELLKLSWDDERVQEIVPENIPLEIIYEDENTLVINKAQGMVTHPGAGNYTGTLANAVLGRVTQDEKIHRAGIVHRLDKDTSGVIIVAKNAAAQEFLCAQFKNRTTKKQYLAIVQGRPAESAGHIENYLARDPHNRKKFAVCNKAGQGKIAVSDYKILRSYTDYNLLSLRPRTGRTHQLRVHTKFLGCPILGDPIYGTKNTLNTGLSLMLHAYRLKIILPGEKEARIFCAPIPERFKKLLK